MLNKNQKTMKKIILILILLNGQIFSQDNKKNQDSSVSLEQITNVIEDLNTLKKDIDSKLTELKEIEKSITLTTEEKKQLKKLNDRFYNKKGRPKRDAKEVTAEDIIETQIQSQDLNRQNNTIEINKIKDEINTTNQQLEELKKTLKAHGVEIKETEKGVKNNSLKTLMSLILGLLLIITSFFIYSLILKNKKKVQNILEMDLELKNILEKQTKILKETKKQDTEKEDSQNELETVKEVADQITNMENNIFHMDKETRGLNRIERAIQNIRRNFHTKGYEIPNLLGQEISKGDVIEVVSEETDTSIEKGKRIITAVVKPTIKLNGEVIQKAKVKLKSNL